MSVNIDVAFVKQYKDNVFHLSQQKGSRLQDKVRKEMQKGEECFYERLGAATAAPIVGRHAPTQHMNSDHSKRRVTMTPYAWSDLIDTQDKVRMLIDPTGPYTQSAYMALGRSKDDILISAALGSSYSGKEGSTAVPLPSTQKIAAWNSSGFSNMNIETLRQAKEIFDGNDVDEEIKRYMAITSKQLRSLLANVEITSSDYNTVKALVNGQVNEFMGFNFIRIERLGLQVDALSASTTTGVVGSGSSVSGFRKCFAWAQDGLLLSTGQDITTKVTEESTLNYATQVYARMDLGATRLEEEKVVEILCKEA